MILSCSSICKSFGSDDILKNASFHIEEHEKAAIVGINGAGKSTLLKIITGELPADSGEVVISKGKTLGYLAQNQDLLSHRTIYDEMLEVKRPVIEMEERLRELLRGVEELRLRAGGSGGLSIQLMTLPAVTCCMRRCEGHTIAEKYNAMYDFYGQCVRQGYRLSDEPIFTISERTDYLEERIGDTPYPFQVCVPVRPENAPKEAVTLPECRALSVLYYGGYDGMDEAFLTLGREVKARGLKPAGFVRVLGIVAPYSGREIETQRYCSRIVLPVEE